MRIGVALSLLSHAGIIAWGVYSWPDTAPTLPEMDILPVDLVEIAEVTDLNLGQESGEEQAQAPNEPAPEPQEAPAPEPEPKPPAPPPPPPPPPEPEPPEPAPEPEPEPAPPEPPPPPPEPEPAPPEPEPEPAPPPPEPREAATVPAAPAPVPRARPRPRPAPPPPPANEPPEENFDADRIAALLDKTETGGGSPSEGPAALGTETGSVDAQMTQSEIDALRQRLAQCWTPPIGWTDPAEVRSVIRMRLNQDGTVAGVPEVVQAPAGRYASTAPESAVRAVLGCAPYNLPAEKYELWRDIEFTFDPRDMAG